MNEPAEQLLVADIPPGTPAHRVTRALARHRFHHISDDLGPAARLWVYCPGGRSRVRSRVRQIIEAALAEDSMPIVLTFADEQEWDFAPADQSARA